MIWQDLIPVLLLGGAATVVYFMIGRSGTSAK
jgi:hypothetical protein